MTAPPPRPPPLSEGLDQPLVWDFKMWPLAVTALTRFFYTEMYGCFVRPKKPGRNNNVTVLPTKLSKQIHTKF